MYELNSENIIKTRKLISDKFAQSDTQEDRFHGENNRNHMAEDFEKYGVRGEFRRDADRILYSKAFRRLEHKAQVYYNNKGDHYRTRLTHTLEVSQIARSISRNLGLNEELAEAIALGHDIGHTPFGHAGEEVLDDIMRGKDDLGGKLKFNIDYGGFKHNFNGLKILEILERRENGTGLNLTWQTLDGILQHTDVVKKNKKWDLKRFVKDTSSYENIIRYDYFDEKSKPEYNYSLTLEGQVVAIADEIAQREHDFDDGLGEGELFRVEGISKEVKNVIESIHDNIDSENTGHQLFLKFYREITQQNPDENNSQWKRLNNIFISYFILDVTENTIRKINECEDIEKYISIQNNRKYITEDLISFSQIGQTVNDKFKELIEKRTINSFDVNRYDEKGKYIIRKLFKAYYENPRQMHRKQLMILLNNIQRVTREYSILNSKFNELSDVDENYMDLKNLNPLLDILKLDRKEFRDEFANIGKPDKFMKEIFKIINFDNEEMLRQNYDFKEISHKFRQTLFTFCNCKSQDKLCRYPEDYKNFLMFIKGWNELHYAYVSTVCEYISQMTDNYAIKEYRELYLD